MRCFLETGKENNDRAWSKTESPNSAHRSVTGANRGDFCHPAFLVEKHHGESTVRAL